jgi:hypothetical protein
MLYHKNVRTTLELDDDLLSAAKQLAQQRGVTLGQLISELARQSLMGTAPQKIRNGVPVFVPRSGRCKPDLKIVNQLRDGA